MYDRLLRMPIHRHERMILLHYHALAHPLNGRHRALFHTTVQERRLD